MNALRHLVDRSAVRVLPAVLALLFLVAPASAYVRWCGDGMVNIDAETCDPPGENAGTPWECRIDCTYCGDGVLDYGEDCDDGNNADGDDCPADCHVVLETCGDGSVNLPGETCDPPGEPAGDADECRADCTFCGDGIQDAVEACDDGNNAPGDGCSPTCEAEFCGDGETTLPGETCDPPGQPAGGADECRADCTYCGDGVRDAVEACDDGNDVVGDGCSPTCEAESCGDGTVNLPGETCDPPGLGGCRADCTYCGDGVRDAQEDCDDGNDVVGDGCSPTCEAESCGDGTVNLPGETCDPPGQPAGAPNECRPDCTYCGDGFLDAFEDCDDGNNVDGDGCESTCIVRLCGDGVRQEGEECDGADLGLATCADVGCTGGAPVCLEDCTLDYGGCAGAACVVLTVDPATALPGDALAVGWDGVLTPTPTDWIGFFPTGANNTSFTAWFYAGSCSKVPGSTPDAGSCPFVLAPDLVPGTYEFRLFTANGYLRLASSPVLTVEADTSGPTVSVDPAEVAPGGAIDVSWSNIVAPTPRDWLGIFSRGAPDSAYVDWFYVSCSRVSGAEENAGSCPWNVPAGLALGPYEVRLFANDGFGILATGGAFEVTSFGQATLEAAPDPVAPGGTVTATWSGIPEPEPTDWIGLFRAGSADVATIRWVYAGSCTRQAGEARAAGSCLLTVPADASGPYELRLFAANGYERLAESDPFQVEAPSGPSLSVSPDTVEPGQTTTVAWTGVGSPTPYDWIGLFVDGDPDDSSLDWRYAGSCAQGATVAAAIGSCPFPVPEGVSGVLRFRLFADNGYDRLAVSGPVVVTASPGASLSAGPDPVAPGGTINAGWSGISDPTPSDWIGLFASGATNSEFRSWIYASSCTQVSAAPVASGQCPLPVAAGLPPGDYELRLFRANSFDLLAVSEIFRVED